MSPKGVDGIAYNQEEESDLRLRCLPKPMYGLITNDHYGMGSTNNDINVP